MNQNSKEALETLMYRLCWIGPVEEAVFDDAVKFIESIPDDVPLPELGLTESEDVTFEWAKNSRQIVTAIVSGNGWVSYSALFGAENTHGFYCLDEPFRPLIEFFILLNGNQEKTK